jgi:hypothetical protein
VVNLSEASVPSPPEIRSKIFSRETNAWIVATFVLTMLAASVLSYTGVLITDPVTAAIDGFLVASVYVGYRILQAYRVLRLRSKMKPVE